MRKLKKLASAFLSLVTVFVLLGSIGTQIVSAATPISKSDREAIIAEAEKHIGKPYVWGGNGPDSFDCSGYTKWVYKHSINYDLPRVSEQQKTHMSTYGIQLPTNDINQWKKGDIIFYGQNGVTEHVAIYYGDGKVIHAVGNKVQINNFGSIIDKNGKKYEILSVAKLGEDEPDKGGFTIRKEDLDGNGLVGAKFEIQHSNGSKFEATTGANGIVTLDNLDLGRYVVTEVQAPDGFLLSSSPIEVTIDGKTPAIEIVMVFKNPEPTGNIHLSKVDSETGKLPQGDGELKNAQYTLYAADKITNKAGSKVHYEKGTEVANRITDEEGNMESILGLPLGKYMLKEIKSPTGYQLDKNEYIIDLTYQGQEVKVVSQTHIFNEDVIKGRVKLLKVTTDEKTGLVTPLSGAEFTFKLKSEISQVGWENAKAYAVVTSDSNGNALTDWLPYGVYEGRETKAPSNYKPVPPFEVTIDKHEEIKGFMFNDAPYTSRLRVVKKDLETGNTILLPDTTFKLKNIDTGEYVKQVIYYPEYQEINKFKTNENGEFTTPENLKSGNYQLEEIQAPQNYYKSSEPFKFELGENFPNQEVIDGEIIATVEILNHPIKGELLIEKFDEDTKEVLRGAFYKLTAREDILAPDNSGAILYEKGSEITIGDSVQGVYATDDNGQIVIENLPLGKYSLQEFKAPDKYIIDNTVYEVDILAKKLQEEPVVEVRKEFTNKRIPPEIKTTAKDKETKTNNSMPVKKVTIVDTVNYKNLIIGQKYTVQGILMDKETGSPLLVNGKKVESEKTFVAKTEEGSINLEFTFDGRALIGKVVVVFEKLFDNKKEVAVHEDINDEFQTITFEELPIQLKTKAKDKESNSNTAKPVEKVTIVDTVSYTNLVIGREYVIKGVIMDSDTKKPLLIDGEQVTAEKAFVAENNNGSIDIEFTFDASALSDKKIVVFEKLFHNDREVASHEDLKDKNQTITFEKLDTPEKPVPNQKGNDFPKTGDKTVASVLLFLAACCLSIIVFVKRRVPKKGQ